VPEVSEIDEAEWVQLTATIESALERQPEAVLKQILLLVRLLDWLPVARHGQRLRSLDLADRTRFLLQLQDSRVALLRRGVWGLRTLVFMGYYTHPGTYAGIGYAAHPRGWEATRSHGPDANPDDTSTAEPSA